MLQRRVRHHPLLAMRGPFEDLRDMQFQINQLFGDLFGRIDDKEHALRETSWEPAVNVVENDEEFLFQFELPGLTLEEIQVTVEGDYLVVAGERRWTVDEDKSRVHRFEQHYGAFRRDVRLPAKVDPNGIRAVLREGVLEIRMPVLEVAKPRVVEVVEA